MSRITDGIRLPVRPTAKGFWPEFKAEVRKNPPNVKISVEPELRKFRAEIAAERKRQEANDIRIGVKTHIDRKSLAKTQAGLQRIEHSWKQSDFSRAIRINLVVAGAVSLPSLLKGLMSLTTAITELGRATLVLPGLFSGIGLSAATAATGLKGVVDALSEVDSSMSSAAQKARQYQQATNNLEKAQRDVVKALKDANREIEDQRTKLTRNQLSVEQAQLNLQKANEAIRKGGFDSVNAWRQAILDQKQAQLDLTDAVRQSKRDIQDYYDTSKKGARQSDTFKDSVDKLGEAIAEFNRRQLEASGFSEKFMQAVESLSPAAKKFVMQVRGLSGVWKDLQNTVQESLFDGIGDQFVNLANKQLPMLKTGMTKVAKGLNTDIKAILSSIGKDANARSISRIFDNTADALTKLQPGLDSLITGFLKLSEVGSKFMPRLANSFNRLMDRFDNFIQRAASDGSLEEWINRGLAVVSSLGRSLLDVMSIFGSITKAYENATGNFGGLATTIEKSLNKWATYLAGSEGQRKLTGWIAETKTFLAEIKKSLPGIRKIFNALGDGFRWFAQNFFPVFAEIGNFLSRFSAFVTPAIALFAAMRTFMPIWSTGAKAVRHFASGVERVRDASRQAAEAQQALAQKTRDAQLEAIKLDEDRIALQDKLRGAITKSERTVAAAQMNKGSAVQIARIDLAQAQAIKADALAEKEAAHRAAMDAKSAYRLQLRQLQEFTNMGGAVGGAIDPNIQRKMTKDGPRAMDTRTGKFVRDPGMRGAIGIEDRLKQIQYRDLPVAQSRAAELKALMELPEYAPDYVDYNHPENIRRKQQKKRLLPGIAYQENLKEISMADATVKAYQAALKGDVEKAAQIAWQQAEELKGRVDAAVSRVDTADKAYNRSALAAQKVDIEGRRAIAEADDILAQQQEHLIELNREWGDVAVENAEYNKEFGKSLAEGANKSLKETQMLLGQNITEGRKVWDSNKRLSENFKSLGQSAAYHVKTGITGAYQTAREKITGHTSAIISRNNSLRENFRNVGVAGKDTFKRLADAVTSTENTFGRVIGRGTKGKGGGVIGIMGALWETMGMGMRAIGGAGSIGLMVALDQLSQAHQKAGDWADYQRQMEKGLADQLDGTTGAVTSAAIAASMERGQNDFQVMGHDNSPIKRDAVADATKAGVPTEVLKQSLNPINTRAVAGVQKTLDEQTLQAVKDGKDQNWNKWGSELQKWGVTPEIYAKAVNGDRAATEKFDKARKAVFYGTDKPEEQKAADPWGWFLAIANRTDRVPDLGAGVESLLNAGVTAPSAAQFQRDTLDKNIAGGDAKKRINTPAKLLTNAPGFPDLFRAAEDVYWDNTGSGVSFVLNNLDKEKLAKLEEIGAAAEYSGTAGRYIIHLDKSLTDKFVALPENPPGYARGGSVWGAGTATSDSIPAMLSNGEFVINAKSASLIGHDVLQQMNQTPHKARNFRFAPGGPVDTPDWEKQARAALDAKGYVASPAQLPTQLPPAMPAYTTPSYAGDPTKATMRPGVVPFGGPIRKTPDATQLADSINAAAAANTGPKPSVVPSLSPLSPDSPLYKDPKHGSPKGGQPGPDGQRSTPGFAPGNIPLAPDLKLATGLYSPENTNPALNNPPAPGLIPGLAPGVIPTYDQLPVPGSKTPATPAAPVTLSGPAADRLKQFAAYADTLNYDLGGFGPQGIDCSGLALAFANVALGKDPFEGGRVGIGPEGSVGFYTGNEGSELAARGFKPGYVPGTLNIGWSAEHSAITLPDGTSIDAQNVKNGVVLGNGSTPATSLPNVMHLPVDLMSNDSPLTPTLPAPGGTDGSNPLIPTIPDVSTATPPPGAVTGKKGDRSGISGAIASAAEAAGIPGLDAPIPGPYGDLPIKPIDLISKIGEALVNMFFGFFGINTSGITGIIDSILGDDKFKNSGSGDGGDVPEENPDPNVDPGPDQTVISDLIQAASEAKGRGDKQTAENLLQRARDYQSSRLLANAPESTLGSLTLDSTQEEVAKAILSEARSRGYTKDQAQAILATAIKESGGLNPKATTAAGLWKGIFQNSKDQGIGPNDPNENISTFFNRLAEKGGPSAPDIWKAIYWIQQNPEAKSIDEAVGGGDKNYLAQIQDPTTVGTAKAFLERLGYRRGGLVRRFATGGLATKSPLDDYGDPWDPWPALDINYGAGYPGAAFLWPHGVMSGQDPMNNAAGGHITGPGTGTSDSIPAMLSNGEFVMRSAAVNHYGTGFMEAINGKKLPRFAPGGQVDSNSDGFSELQKQLFISAFRDPNTQLAPAEPKVSPRRGRFSGSRRDVPKPATDITNTLTDSQSSRLSQMGSIGYWIGRQPGSGSALGNLFLDTSLIPDLNRSGKVLKDPNSSGFDKSLAALDLAPFAMPGAGSVIGTGTGFLGKVFGKVLSPLATAVGRVSSPLVRGVGDQLGKAAAKVSGYVPQAVRSMGSDLSYLGSRAKQLTGALTTPLPAGAVPKASRADRKAALEGTIFNLDGAGFFARRNIKNSIADLKAAFPGVDLAEVRLQPDMVLNGAYAQAWQQSGVIDLNKSFFGRNKGLKLDRSYIDSVKSGFHPELGPRANPIFSILAHEFGHIADGQFGQAIGERDIGKWLLDHFDEFYDGLGDLGGFRNASIMYPREFSRWAFNLLPTYAYAKQFAAEGGMKDFAWIQDIINAPDAFRGRSIAANSFSRTESIAEAFTDVAGRGINADLGSRILQSNFLDFILGNGAGASSRRAAALGSTPATGRRVRGPMQGPITAGQAAKEELAGSVTGAVGGDFVSPNVLTQSSYDRIIRSRGKGIFTKSGRGDTEKMVQNILARYNDTTGEKAWIRESGMRWYSDAREFLLNLMKESGTTWNLEQAGAALAALSGNSGWNDNMISAIKFFADPNSLKLTQPGVEAALRVVNSSNPLDDLGVGGDGALKWKNFAASILGIKIDGKDPVAVDRWAARVALGTGDKELAGKALGRTGAYDKIAEAYRIAASRAGISSEQMQAIAWMHVIKPPTMAMWDDIAKFRSTGRWGWQPKVSGSNFPLGAPGPMRSMPPGAINPADLSGPISFDSTEEARNWANELYPTNQSDALQYINPSQIAALMRYTEMPDVNLALRGIFNSTDPADWVGSWGRYYAQRLMRDVPLIDGSIDNYPSLAANLMLHHKLHSEFLLGRPLPIGKDLTMEWLMKNLVGKSMNVDGYLSTSLTPWRFGPNSMKTTIELNAPKGTRGVWLGGGADPKNGGLSSHPNENEFLTDRGNQILFNGVRPNDPNSDLSTGGFTVMGSLIQPDKRPDMPKLPSDLAALFEQYRNSMGYGGYSSGGHVRGPGTGTSDSIPALLSDGEFVMRSKAVKHWGVGRLSAMNAISKYADGGPVEIDPVTGIPVPPPTDPPVETAIPVVPNEPPLDPNQPDPNQENPAPTPPENVLGTIAGLMPTGGGGGVASGIPESIDPRARLAPAPTSSEHTNPAIAAGIKGAFDTVGNVAQLAATFGSMGATGGAGAAMGAMPGGGPGGAGGELAKAAVKMAGDLVVGGVNVLSSLGVGTVTPSQTGQGYGAPLLKQQPQTPVNNFQSVHNGDVVTNNLNEYSRLKDRKEAQRAAPFFNRTGS